MPIQTYIYSQTYFSPQPLYGGPRLRNGPNKKVFVVYIVYIFYGDAANAYCAEFREFIRPIPYLIRSFRLATQFFY